MSEELKQKLAGEILRYASWEDMRPHVIRQVVFVVRELTLLEVGVALGIDDSANVAQWVQNGNLARPQADEVARWAEQHAMFAALIVDPFVLIQEEGGPPPQDSSLN
jgi:hypothetical protein